MIWVRKYREQAFYASLCNIKTGHDRGMASGKGMSISSQMLYRYLWMVQTCSKPIDYTISHMLHVGYIYLHLGDY